MYHHWYYNHNKNMTTALVLWQKQVYHHCYYESQKITIAHKKYHHCHYHCYYETKNIIAVVIMIAPQNINAAHYYGIENTTTFIIITSKDISPLLLLPHQKYCFCNYHETKKNTTAVVATLKISSLISYWQK